MDYITVREAAEKWGVSERRINQYCAEGRIPGAEPVSYTHLTLPTTSRV